MNPLDVSPWLLPSTLNGLCPVEEQKVQTVHLSQVRRLGHVLRSNPSGCWSGPFAVVYRLDDDDAGGGDDDE